MGTVKSYVQIVLWSGRNLLQRGGLTAPWLLFSGQGAKCQGDVSLTENAAEGFSFALEPRTIATLQWNFP